MAPHQAAEGEVEGYWREEALVDAMLYLLLEPRRTLGAEGGETPIAGFWTGDGAASICSFSGLNDVINEEEPIMVQSYGQYIVLFGKDNVENNPERGPPGVACNPTKGPNPKG